MYRRFNKLSKIWSKKWDRIKWTLFVRDFGMPKFYKILVQRQIL